MSTIPRTQADAIQFIETHLPIWIENPGAIGLSPPQLTALADAATRASQDLAAARQAREAAEAATTRLRSSMEQMRAIAGPIIAAIRAFAEGSDDPCSIYAQAQIPPRAAKSPAPAPETPVFESFDLLGDGALRLRWRVTRPAPNTPVHTRIRRRLPGESQFTLLGDTAEKHFIDRTLPVGGRGGSAVYQFQAVGGGGRGRESDWSQGIGVQFGSVPAAEMGALAAAGGVKLAAPTRPAGGVAA